MYWQDEGYLLAKNNFDENSIIIEVFTLDHGKYNGIVYGGSSRKQKKNFQIGNKILLNWKAKNQNKPGYFNVELLEPISPYYFDDKKKSSCILSAASILKILLPERQINKIVYCSFDKMLKDLKLEKWINLYIHWELSLIKELGFEINYKNNSKYIEINGKKFQIPNFLLNNKEVINKKKDILEALVFNKNLLIENFIAPNNLNFPIYRNIFEGYFK